MAPLPSEVRGQVMGEMLPAHSSKRSGDPGSGRKRLYDIVYSAISDQIRAGTLRPGTVIREKNVAEVFGIGRMPAADALTRLMAEGYVHRRPPMHGLVVGSDPATPLVTGEGAARIELPREIEEQLRVRNWRTLIYPIVEREVASCLLFGRFQIRSQALAEHFGVSRTIANELLLRLERVDLVRQESNARWYAGPLSSERITELYEMRMLLEPPALVQSAPLVGLGVIRAKLQRLERGQRSKSPNNMTLMQQIEIDLHNDIVLQCTNAELRHAIIRCQLPLLSGLLNLGDDPDADHVYRAHRRVYELLIERRVEAAAAALTDHIREGKTLGPSRFAMLQPTDLFKYSSYLDPA